MRTGDVEPPAGYTADDFRIETFRTLAEAFPEHVLDLEIKVPLDNAGENDIAYAIEAARVLAADLEELDRTDSVIVTSFSSDVMIAFREFAPDVATSPGEDEMVAWYLGTGGITEQDVLAQLPPERLRDRHPRSRTDRPYPGRGHRTVDLAELRRPGERGVLPVAV